jgi:hypothetical protein
MNLVSAFLGQLVVENDAARTAVFLAAGKHDVTQRWHIGAGGPPKKDPWHARCAAGVNWRLVRALDTRTRTWPQKYSAYIFRGIFSADSFQDKLSDLATGGGEIYKAFII